MDHDDFSSHPGWNAGTALPRRRASFFEEDFDLPPPAPQAAPEPEIIEPLFTLAELEASRATAWQDGHGAAMAEAGTTDAATARDALMQIAATLNSTREEAMLMAEETAESVARLLMDAFALAFPALCVRHGDMELRAILRAIVPAMRQEPAITVRAAPHSVRAVNDELERLDPELIPHVQVIPTDAVARGDIRISWRNGSAVRDTKALWHQIAGILAPSGLLTTEATTREMEHVE